MGTTFAGAIGAQLSLPGGLEVVSSCLAALAALWFLSRVHLRRRQRGQEWLRAQARGPLQLELRRSTGMQVHGDGLGGQSFPSPIETRTLTLLLAGLPLWTRSESIGLPPGSEVRLHELWAPEFDAHFTADFRLDPAPGGPRFGVVLAG